MRAMTRTRAVLGLATVTSTSAFVGLAARPSRVARCYVTPERRASFWGGDRDDGDDSARLRRENEALRERLAQVEKNQGRAPPRAEGPGVLETAKNFVADRVNDVKGLIGLKKKDEEDPLAPLTREVDRAVGGGGLVGGLVGTLVKGAFSIIGGLVRDSRADIQLVSARVETLLEPQLGQGVKLNPPYQQAYSSSNINGAVTKRVQLATTATAAETGLVADVLVTASIQGRDDVAIERLIVNGRPVDTTRKKMAKSSPSETIIDV